MASIKDIRRRIGSVKNTQQITKAMKMVSASKLRRAQNAISGARPYAEKLEEVTGRIVKEILEGYSSLDEAKKTEVLSKLHPLLKVGTSHNETESEQKKKIALVVITSDRGLCGAYNTNIIRHSFRRYKELTQDAKTEVSFYFIGKRGHDFFTKRGVAGHYFHDFWAGRFTTIKSDSIAQHFVGKFLAGEIDSVEFCFTKFQSALSQNPETKQVLPISLPMEKIEGAQVASMPFIYEPSRKEILGTLLPRQVKTAIYRVCAESLASEFGARMTAMDNASRNARDMIARLSLQANRLRQANITTELMEIIGGAEALKG